MANIGLWDIELIPWYAFAIYWCVNALRVKSAKVTEPLPARLLEVLTLAAAFYLMFSGRIHGGWLRERFVASTPWLNAVGVVMTYAGIALAIWARWNLGRNWSARVTLKVDHELICSGPYARLRHPIYSGLLLAAIGTAMVIGEWRGLLAIVVVGVVHSFKAKREETLMLATFGDKYQSYRQQTGFLLPKF
ncbi:MAG TPA: isoprenylcysteine carboxylmethyltransferase family protein [Terriglobales bacterium]|nr:isoprenylcysteine carboxylmethyltransferase family protein [Terriglobales bacterium]